jgi:phospholipid/cholesterol/gamma-HCH transport system substrate-binding protein
VTLTVAVATIALAWAGGFDVARTYVLTADFTSADGLVEGAPVAIADVPIGTVESIALRHDAAHVVLRVSSPIEIPETSVAAVKSRGLIGDAFVEIMPGTGGRMLHPGERIRHTVGAVDLEDAIGAFIFGRL